MRAVLACAFAVATALSFSSQAAFAYGAIAVNDEKGLKPEDVGYGVGTGDTRAAAENNALRTCKKAGNDSCEIAVWYEKCGAYATSKGYSGIGFGDTKDAAEQVAMSKCNSNHCKIVVSDCDD